MKNETMPSTRSLGTNQASSGVVQAHLGRKLRELFNGFDPGPLPQRLVELLDVLTAKERQDPLVRGNVKDAMLQLMPGLRGFAFSLCAHHERADDLVQDTLLRAWSHIDSFRDGSNLRAWLFTILRNAYFSDLRRRRREVEDADGMKAARMSVAPAQQAHLDMQDFRKAFDLLPPDQREALMLVGAAGMSYEETAEVTGWAVGTVKSRVSRARVKLGTSLGVDSADAFGPDFAIEAIISGSGKAR